MSKCKCCKEENSNLIDYKGYKMCSACYMGYVRNVIVCENNAKYETEIDQLKQQLAEKDKEINSLIVDYEKRISQEQELMSNMEHQLTEKQNTIDEINKEFVQAVHDWKALCAEKDKEIATLKAEIIQECKEHQDIMQQFEQVEKQFAIQELEKVKEDCFNQKELVDFGNVACFMVDIADILEIITNQIKELKGEKDVED